MKERFQGEDGRRRLISLIQRQKIVQGDLKIAQLLEEKSTLEEFKPGDLLIEQNNEDYHMLLIIVGRVNIIINGRDVAQRESGEHVGEMAMIDPSALRSANVVAEETTVCVKVEEEDFVSIANDYPELWRQIALELADRIRQRKLQLEPTNSRPIVFVGSSVESLSVAYAIRDEMDHDKCVVRLWSNGGVFGASEFAIDDLLNQVKQSDFAILVLGPDDVVISRDDTTNAPRDNVIFELGLFMGFLGRQRVFIVKPRGIDIKIPSDLIGLKILDYRSDPSERIEDNIGTAANSIRKLVDSIGAK